MDDLPERTFTLRHILLRQGARNRGLRPNFLYFARNFVKGCSSVWQRATFRLTRSRQRELSQTGKARRVTVHFILLNAEGSVGFS